MINLRNEKVEGDNCVLDKMPGSKHKKGKSQYIKYVCAVLPEIKVLGKCCSCGMGNITQNIFVRDNAYSYVGYQKPFAICEMLKACLL